VRSTAENPQSPGQAAPRLWPLPHLALSGGPKPWPKAPAALSLAKPATLLMPLLLRVILAGCCCPLVFPLLLVWLPRPLIAVYWTRLEPPKLFIQTLLALPQFVADLPTLLPAFCTPFYLGFVSVYCVY